MTMIYDTRIPDPKGDMVERRTKEILFELRNHMEGTDEYKRLIKELFGDNLGENCEIGYPIIGSCITNTRIGNNVKMMGYINLMARGGITIEDNVQIGANVQILTNNHDPYNIDILTLHPVTIKESAWIAAGASILPGVTVGKHAIVGACSVVTKDVPDYAVVAGNPAKVLKMLDPAGFEK